MSNTARLERWDVSLDHRQLFFILFGTAAVACMVFVMGIYVGKRLEARASVGTSCGASIDDLDKIPDDPVTFTFHKVLVRKVKNPNLPPEVYEMAHFGETGSAKGSVASGFGLDQGSGLDRAASPDKGSGMATGDSRQGTGRARGLAANGLVRHKGRRFGMGAAARVRTHGAQGPAVQSRHNAAAKVRTTKRRFTLQVSSFRSRKEAGAMIHKLEIKGFKPYLMTSYIPKRGMWYRVRVGAFGSWGTAMGAKKRFEKEWRMTAYVTRMH